MLKVSVVHVIGILAIGGVEKRLLSLVKKQLSDPNFESVTVVYFYEGNLKNDFLEIESNKYTLISAMGNHINRVRIISGLLKPKDILHLYNFSGIFSGCLASLFVDNSVKVISHIGGVASVFSPIQLFIEKYLLFKTNIFIYNSKSTQKVFESKNVFRSNSKVVHNGIQLSESIRGVSSHSNSCFRFVSVGRINRNKNLEFNINLISELSKLGHNVRYDIIGDGDLNYVDGLKELVKTKGVNNAVHFHGFIKNPMKSKFFITADYIFCCSFSETFGLSVVEAMSNHIVPIVSSIGGLPEVVNNGKAGIMLQSDVDISYEVLSSIPVKEVWNSSFNKVVPVKDVSLDKALKVIVEYFENEEKYTQMANSAFEFSKHFTIEAYHKKIYDIYRGDV